MKYLKKYDESILSRGIEMINYNPEADRISEKYIKMIYDDYNKHKDLFRISMSINDSHTTVKYMISSGSQNDVQSGNRDENAITINLMYIKNLLRWSGDQTRARIEAEKFKSYKGTIPILGRVIKSGKIIENEDGIITDNETISYINIPSNGVKKLISFFIKEFGKKYPLVSKYYGKRSILEKYPEERENSHKQYKIEADASAKSHKLKQDAMYNLIIPKVNVLEFEEESLLDYFQEVEDEIKIDLLYRKTIYLDRSIYESVKLKSFPKEIVTEYSLDGLINKNKNMLNESQIILKKNVPYHTIIINLLEECDSFKEKVDIVIKRFCSERFGLKLCDSFLVVDDGSDDGGYPYTYSCMKANEQIRTFGHTVASYILYLSEI